MVRAKGEVSGPTDPFIILVLQNPSHDYLQFSNPLIVKIATGPVGFYDHVSSSQI